MRILAIDIGASKVEYAAMAKPGKKDITRIEIGCTTDAPELVSIIRGAVEKYSPGSVGLSLPGFVVGGRPVALPNLPGVDCKKFMDSLRRLPARIAIGNDVKCMASAEWDSRGRRADDNFFLVAPGSGIGGAMVAGGRLFRGAHNVAGEAGHFPMRNAQGEWTEWERLCGGMGIEREWKKLMKTRRSAKEIFSMRGSLAKKITREAAGEFGAGLAGIAAVLDPAEFVVAGSVGKEYMKNAALRREMMQTFRRHAIGPTKNIPIRLSTQGYPALRGAWLMADNSDKRISF